MPTPEGLYTREELKEAIESAVKERIAEASRSNKAVREELEKHAQRIKELEPMEARTKELEAQVRRQSDHLVAARAGVTDPKQARRLRAAYEADMEEVAEKDRPSLEAWIATDDGKAVVHQFRPPSPATPATLATPAQPAAPASAANPAAPAVAPPAPTPVGAPAPPPATRMSREQYAERSRDLLNRRAHAQGPERERIDAELHALKALAMAPATP